VSALTGGSVAMIYQKPIETKFFRTALEQVGHTLDSCSTANAEAASMFLSLLHNGTGPEGFHNLV
jgi:hypothetical protein